MPFPHGLVVEFTYLACGASRGYGRGADTLSTFILSFSTTLAVETRDRRGAERFRDQ
jgi:hypothetical protein